MTLFAVGFAIGFHTARRVASGPATPPQPAPAHRSKAEPSRRPTEQDPAPDQTVDRAEFARRLRAIANAATAVGELWDSGQRAAAADLDRRCNARLAELVVSRTDAGECALAELTSHRTPRNPGLVAVTRRLLIADCERRINPRPLVTTALEAANSCDLAARAIDGLTNGDWFDSSHAPAIVAFSTRETAPGSTRLAMLRALWRNWRPAGPGSEAHLTRTARTWLMTGNPCQRQVAYEHLLRNSRHRESLLGHLRRTERDEFTQRLAIAIGTFLPTNDAGTILLQLSRAGTSVTAAWLALGERDPAPLREAYCACLADTVAPATRRDILTGLGLASASSPTGTTTVPAGALEVLEFAATNEPLHELRLHSLTVLSAVAPARFGSAADAFFSAHPSREHWSESSTQAFVFAIRNLVAAGATAIAQRCMDQLTEHGLDVPATADLRRVALEGLPRSASWSAARSEYSAY